MLPVCSYKSLLIVVILAVSGLFSLGCDGFPEQLPESHFEPSEPDAGDYVPPDVIADTTTTDTATDVIESLDIFGGKDTPQPTDQVSTDTTDPSDTEDLSDTEDPSDTENPSDTTDPTPPCEPGEIVCAGTDDLGLTRCRLDEDDQGPGIETCEFDEENQCYGWGELFEPCDDEPPICSVNACVTEEGMGPSCDFEAIDGGHELCDDGDPCTINGECVLGECESDVKNCNDDNPCTTDSCVSENPGGCHHVAFAGSCDDGDACTNGDYCEASLCEPGKNAVECDDEESCTSDVCDPDQGCVFIMLGGSCNDNDPCTIGDTCDSGVCTSGLTPLDCDDENVCTTEFCEPGYGCQIQPNDFLCDDDLVCTDASVCSQGSCVGTLDKDCSNLEAPCMVVSCNEASGQCESSPQADTAPCDDSDPCTLNDSCSNGWCLGETTVVCDDGFDCTSEVCGANGECEVSEVLSGACFIDNECYEGGQVQGGCKQCAPGSSKTLWTPSPNGNSCSYASLCLQGGGCLEGECIGAEQVECPPNDANDCVTHYCDASIGCTTSIEEDGTLCDEGGDFCAEWGFCEAGICSFTEYDCDDGIDCTFDFCDPTVECVNLGNNDACNDGNQCTADSCKKTLGCQYNMLSQYCDDGDPCTNGDYCVLGTCDPGSVPSSGVCGDGFCGAAEAAACSCFEDCPASCGNGCCDPGEFPDMGNPMGTCPEDCSGQAAGICGDGVCDCDTEDCFFCPSDCNCTFGDPCDSCGDGTCDCSDGENCDNCPIDCICTESDEPIPGCYTKASPSCAGCGCMQCVCDQKQDCCTNEWGPECVLLCTQCGGCEENACPSCYGNILNAGQFGIPGASADNVVDVFILEGNGPTQQKIVVAGTFKDYISFYPSGLIDVTPPTAETQQGYVAFLDPYYTPFQLVTGYALGDNTANVELTAMAGAANGDIYVAGSFSGIWDLTPLNLVGSISPDGLTDCDFDDDCTGNTAGFLAKLTASNGVQWIKMLDSNGQDTITDIAINDGGVVATGFFSGTDLPLEGIGDLLGSTLTNTAFVVRFDETGITMWGITCGAINGGTGGEFEVVKTASIASDNFHNVYVTGAFLETLQCGDSGPSIIGTPPLGTDLDLFVLRINPSGDPDWLIKGGGAGDQMGLSIKSDLVGSVLLAGIFSENINLNGAGVGGQVGGENEQFVAKLKASNGEVIGTRSLGSHGDSDFNLNIGLDKDGFFLVASTNEAGAAFPGTDLVLVGNNTKQAYVAKLSPNTLKAIWATGFNFNAAGNEMSMTGVASDQYGDMYSVGTFDNQMTYVGSTGGIEIMSATGGGSQNAIIMISK